MMIILFWQFLIDNWKHTTIVVSALSLGAAVHDGTV